MAKEVKKHKGNHPIEISEDIWFYNKPKSLHFVVWSSCKLCGAKQATQFSVRKSKIPKTT